LARAAAAAVCGPFVVFGAPPHPYGQMANGQPLLGEGGALLYDTVNSYYCGVARMALHENDVPFRSEYLSMPRQQHLAPWFARLNPEMQLPTLLLPSGAAVTESRGIVTHAYGGGPGSAAEEEVLDWLYREDAGSLAWLTGREKIPLLKVVLGCGMQRQMVKTFQKIQQQAPDLHDVYAAKMKKVSKKHFSKEIGDVASRLAETMGLLERAMARSPGPWLLGSQFGRADAVAVVWLQWVARCNEYGAAPVAMPQALARYLERAKERPAYQKALGQYGRDAFVLHMIARKNRVIGSILLVLVSALLFALWHACGGAWQP